MSSVIQHDIKLIAGLGNPGPDYSGTRHNVGQWFVEALARRFSAQLKLESKYKAQVALVRIAGKEVRLMMPTTYMNESGQAISSLANFFKIKPEEILIVHDELDLAPGIARLKSGGGHGGHNGLRDSISRLGNNNKFLRLRLGIGHPGDKNKVTPYVLKNPNVDDRILIEQSIEWAIDVLEQVISGNLQAAMTALHTKK